MKQTSLPEKKKPGIMTILRELLVVVLVGAALLEAAEVLILILLGSLLEHAVSGIHGLLVALYIILGLIAVVPNVIWAAVLVAAVTMTGVGAVLLRSLGKSDLVKPTTR